MRRRIRSGRVLGMHRGAIHLAVRVGYVHLRVADLERALGLCRDGLGFCVTADAREAGLEVVALEAGDYHPHIVLGAGTADRFVLALCGDSCQDGRRQPGDPVVHRPRAVGRQARRRRVRHAHGGGVASFAEDAADRDRMTLIGRISG